MKVPFRKFISLTALLLVLTMCLLAVSGCAGLFGEPAVSDSDAEVSTADLSDEAAAKETAVTSPADIGTVLTTTATTTAAATTTQDPAKTTWNDEHPTVPYSRTKYRIVVYIGSQSTVVYSPDENGEYTNIVKSFSCSTGASETPTESGYYRARAKYRWRFMNGVYGQYCTSISTRYLFHSVPYKKKDVSTMKGEEYDKLGGPASHGCIRLCVADCKWLYDNIPLGTEVQITRASGPAGAGIPQRNQSSAYDGWDPSDKWAQGSPYFNNVLSDES